ncbi:MAG: glycosyl hydrolase [bacterium]
MKRLAIQLTLAVLVLNYSPCTTAETIKSIDEVRSLFAVPPVEYRSAPLVVWNDDMTEEKITDMLNNLHSQGVWQMFVHPRPGLVTPYLSDRWFEMYKWTLKEAERLGMRVWIYDENSYPSGFASGHVPQNMPESIGLGLDLQQVDAVPKDIGDDVVAVHHVIDSGQQTKTEDITEEVRDGKAFPDGKYLIFSVRKATMGSPWFGGYCYVDLLRPGVTEEFLRVTLEAYREHLGDQFGKLIPGSFADEPHLRPAGGIHWSEDFLNRFENRWGYSLREHLPSLFENTGDFRRVRYNWNKFLLEQFIEHWGKPYYEYCEKNNLVFTGHYWEHSWPNCNGVPDNMAMAAWQQLPGIDCLMNQYKEDTHAQFGNVRAVKEVTSLVNQLGRERFLCEAYGASGWDFDFQGMKRIADWLCVLGVNLIDQHLCYTTIRGARKRDHPPSFTYHEPWWPLYHASADYLARMMLALSSGRQENHVLVIEPTSSAWMYLTPSGDAPQLKEIGDRFQEFLVDLESTQVEYDLGCEQVIEENGSAVKDRLRIGQRDYGLVVLPPGLKNLNSKTAEILKAYLKGGGEILSVDNQSILIDGSESEEFAAECAGKNPQWSRISANEAIDKISAKALPAVTISKNQEFEGTLFHHLRVLNDAQVLFLVNTSLESPAKGSCSLQGKSVEKWDLVTGNIEPYPSRQTGDGLSFGYSLPPAGSLLLCISSKKAAGPTPSEKAEKVVSILKPTSPPVVHRSEPNVLTIDFCDVAVGGENRESVYFHPAQQLVFQKHGFKQNLWERSVQFKDSILKQDHFGPETGFEARYHFTVSGFEKNPDLSLVIERPDFYTITVNDSKTNWDGNSWWLDKDFGRMDISEYVKKGENVVCIKASPFSLRQELESAYILGDFSLKTVDRGFEIVPPKALTLGPWSKQGLPLYSHTVNYTETFEVPADHGHLVLCLGEWRGSVASVSVNGEEVGVIGWQPWEIDVTGYAKPGRNTVTVTVYGTLKNTLGPHHGSPSLGTAWPGMFQKGPDTGPPPGEDYSVVEYGLFEPYRIENRQ